MKITEYRTNEIRPNTILLENGRTLRVTHVVLRIGRGLELFTRCADNYAGPTLYPHPDETLPVLHMPAMSDDEAAFARVTTLDFPWAEVRI